MFFYSILAFSLFFASDASSVPKVSRSNVDSVGLVSRQTDSTVLGPVSQLHVANHVVSPDGFSRPASLYNGQLPGPLIRAYKDDKFSIKVLNELTNVDLGVETALHCHGMFQRKSNWADGASSVTQCPIRQNRTFVQKFHPVGQTGTYWYHSHFAGQRCHGLGGPLVIYDPEDPLGDLYDVDDENTIISLGDWYHDPNAVTKVFEFPNSTLINGKGRFPGGPSTPLSVVNVEQGLRYRFRVINMACESSFNFTIDGHRMTIIETDGIETFPVEVDSLSILAGQRYSVVVAADKPVGNYWIRSLSNLPGATFDGGQSMGILRYEGAADEDPKSPPGPYELPFNEGDIHPLWNLGVPGVPEIGKADVNLVLAPSFNPAEGNFSLGNVTYANPPVPVLLQILNGARNVTDLLPKGSVYVLPRNKVIEISFPNATTAPGGPHPIHLHGNNFDVVRVAGTNEANFIDPVRRDVVSLGNNPTDNVTIRFFTDNDGPWLLHCHLDGHFLKGFAAILAVAPDETAYEESEVVPEGWKDLCED